MYFPVIFFCIICISYLFCVRNYPQFSGLKQQTLLFHRFFSGSSLPEQFRWVIWQSVRGDVAIKLLARVKVISRFVWGRMLFWAASRGCWLASIDFSSPGPLHSLPQCLLRTGAFPLCSVAFRHGFRRIKWWEREKEGGRDWTPTQKLQSILRINILSLLPYSVH